MWFFRQFSRRCSPSARKSCGPLCSCSPTSRELCVCIYSTELQSFACKPLTTDASTRDALFVFLPCRLVHQLIDLTAFPPHCRCRRHRHRRRVFIVCLCVFYFSPFYVSWYAHMYDLSIHPRNLMVCLTGGTTLRLDTACVCSCTEKIAV